MSSIRQILIGRHRFPGAPALCVAFLIAGLTGSAAAQSYGVGVAIGLGTDLSDDFGSREVDDQLIELQFEVEIEDDVIGRLRLGQLTMDPGDSAEPEVEMSRLTFEIEYQFTEEFYETGVFLGLGYFKVDSGTQASWNDGDEHFGLHIGVNGRFRFGPDLALVPEIRLERIENADARTIAHFAVGLVYNF